MSKQEKNQISICGLNACYCEHTILATEMIVSSRIQAKNTDDIIAFLSSSISSHMLIEA